jgi:hypothetical protein
MTRYFLRQFWRQVKAGWSVLLQMEKLKEKYDLAFIFIFQHSRLRGAFTHFVQMVVCLMIKNGQRSLSKIKFLTRYLMRSQLQVLIYKINVLAYFHNHVFYDLKNCRTMNGSQKGKNISFGATDYITLKTNKCHLYCPLQRNYIKRLFR